MPHPESSSSASLPSSAETEAMGNPYAAIKRNDRKQVPQEMTEDFRKLITHAILRCSLPMQSPRSCVEQFLRRVQKTTLFRFRISGEDELEHADIILANHQGPRVDEEQASQATECVSEQSAIQMGRGGSECLYAHALIPPGTRYVLKKYLVQIRKPLHGMAAALVRRQWKKAKQELERIIKARAFLKTRPITVDRTLTKPSRYTVPPDLPKEERENWRQEHRQPWREYAAAMRHERKRIATETVAAVNEGETLIVYPEGTRSPDGNILGFVSEYFEHLVTDYMIPRIRDERDIRIGLLVADTLRAFPHGVGKGVPAYDEPVTLKGVGYDPTRIIDALQERVRQADPLSTEEIRRYGRLLLMDIRSAMSRTLKEIVTTAD